MEVVLIGVIILLAIIILKQKSGGEVKQLSKELEQMKTFVETKFFQQSTSLDNRLSAATKNLIDVTKLMSEVKESNKHIHELGKDISSLSDILTSPKLRGNLGEYLLEELLQNYFHRDHYSLQYQFSSGERVDVCIHLYNNYKLCIDAKFPLTNFQKMIEEEGTNREKFLKQFVRDVKKHIDDIHKKYIVPNEGTLEFALMYIPAESVYYEIIASGKDIDLVQYAFEKRVIPVSPSTLFSYMQVLLLGFKGLQIEKQAENILKTLNQLQKSVDGFQEEYNKVGRHITNASGAFQNSTSKLEKIQQISSYLENTEQQVAAETSNASEHKETLSLS